MRVSAFIYAIIGLIISSVAAYIVANIAVDNIENSAERTAKTALVASGQNWVDVSADGTFVILNGTAPDEKSRLQAINALAAVISAKRLKDETEVKETIATVAPDFSLEILRSGADISLIGITPEISGNEAINNAIKDIDDVALIDMKDSTTWPAPEGWEEAIALGTEIMAELDRAKISISPGKVHVIGMVASDSEKATVEKELNDMAQDSVALTLDITAPRPIFAPYSLTFEISGEDYEFSCHSLTEEGADTILSAIQNGGIETSERCKVGLGAPTENWATVAKEGIEAIYEMDGGRLEMRDSTMSIIAPKDYDDVAFEKLLSNLQDNLPEAYLLRSELPVTEVVEQGEVPLIFTATRNEDNSVILEGVAIDEISQTTLVAYAESKCGHGVVVNNTERSTAPHGWTRRQISAIDALALLNDGEIVVTADTVTVRGKGQVENLNDEIKKILETTFGADARFDISVEEIPQPTEEETRLDPKLCELEIAELLSAKQILFAPSSAVIEAESESVVSDIASILNNCRHAAFEVGGHTDSQGREEMNKNLSQSRADAVVDALLSQNLLLGELTAVGYGEVEPIADNGTEEGRQKNRRIAFKLIVDEEDTENDTD